MIGYVTLGSNDRQKAGAFYDELLGLLGAKRAMVDGDRFIGWSNGQGAMLAVIKPYDGNPATVGNGNMVSLAVGSRENVDKIHAKALALGGKDEGAPGLRGGNFYGAYFRDLDGNKLCAFHMG
ncbi:MAG TPA: VOC family protein [Parvibaculum sp.]|uniref:VOC family protein n=1 Tax=Parvibaculum sp. TaxID=2024848 RepID=UPI002C957B2E|nr:VOC family protein [Parvibaculum sp.]HMM15020.1 VOC family protein [Parvibaculum sp.]